MQKTIELLKEHDLLKVIDAEVDIDLEMAHIAYIEVKSDDSKALLFTHPVSKRLNKKFDIPVLMNVFGSYEATKLIFNKEPDTIAKQIEKFLHMKPPSNIWDKFGMLNELFSLKNVFPKRLNLKAACQENVWETIDLFDLPILKTWSQDGGAFITMGQVYTQSLDGNKHNLGMYRLQLYDKTRLGMHWQIHKDGAHFFNEYKKAGKKMPVSIAIGGDPLYIWCGQAPMPNGMFELLLYGLIREKNARLVQSKTNPIYVPIDSDIVIEGWVDPQQSEIEGPFGDHTGYYTPMEPYPVMDVTGITTKTNPIYQATVVGKPPLEDKYMGWATERIFLPLLQTTTPDLIDYRMPENGVFHNLIIAKMRTLYPGHAKQFMHAFWGVGQMSFVKHAFFVNEDAPALDHYDDLSDYILDRVSVDNILISEGVCDALDHASPNACYGGKLGVDCTADNVSFCKKEILQDAKLYDIISKKVDEVVCLHQYKTHTKTPITVLALNKKREIKELYEDLKEFQAHMKLLVFVDMEKNDIENPYMLIWRVVNNIDAKRDLFLNEEFIGIDATSKNENDGYMRDWPQDTDCDQKVLESLIQRGLIKNNKELFKNYHV
ncbi:menaquinone biosynthesis decarboxylase [Sulfurospirillum sp. 1612]|uniref:menaquinone biosynthesis decarboxylase n=1 Tax=Sulfurospirillum sp. 1612 TaxID=3094835 RepID=UPI002F934F6A